jgi:homocysteine S-methyltransferase
MQNSQFAKALHSGRVLLLDGGLATQLEAQGEDISGVLWSAKLLQTNPQAIIAATRAFLEAGADIVETASYQASREGFAQCGIGAREADDLMRRSAELAILARDEYLRDHPGGRRAPLVAASIGPYGAIPARRLRVHG